MAPSDRASSSSSARSKPKASQQQHTTLLSLAHSSSSMTTTVGGGSKPLRRLGTPRFDFAPSSLSMAAARGLQPSRPALPTDASKTRGDSGSWDKTVDLTFTSSEEDESMCRERNPRSTRKPQSKGSATSDKKRKAAPIIDLVDEDDVEVAVPARRDKAKGKGKAFTGSATMPPPGAFSRVDAGLWTDLYAPMNAADLAVHKKKVNEVRDWLIEAFAHAPGSNSAALPSTSKVAKYRRILALSGPAGVGKTATVRAIAAELGLEIVEWVEGASEGGIGGVIGPESLSSRLTAFLSRHAYPSLSLSNESSSSSSSSQTPYSSTARKILLIDDLPNISHLTTREAFQASLLEFATAWTPESCPLVIIITDAGVSGRAQESWMDHRRGEEWNVRGVLGREVGDGVFTRVVSFNPIAPTLLLKSLKRTLALASGPTPPSEALELIVHSSNGDIRSAINALQFMAKLEVSRTPAVKSSGKKATGRGSRGGKPPSSGNKELKALLDAVTRREQSLALWHALGRVLYNKRVDDPGDEDEEPIPPLPDTLLPLSDKLADREKRQTRVDVEALFTEAPVDTSLYSLYLHQNYPLFCNDIDECASIMETLSGADSLRTDEDMWQSSPTSIAYAFNFTVRGILDGLPSPVPRRGQKMYKPDFFEAFKQQRDNEAVVSEVESWAASHLGIIASGQISRRGLTTLLIPSLRHLSIPPTYPARLPALASLPYSSAGTTTRSLASLRSVLGIGDAVEPGEGGADAEVVDEDGMDPGVRMFTPREAGDGEGEEGDLEAESSEVTEDIEEFEDL